MFQRRLTVFLVFACLLQGGIAISQLQVYANVQGNDSMAVAVRDITQELAKAGFAKHTIYPTAAFKGSGILLLERKDAQQQSVKYSDGLKKFGVEGVYINSTSQSLTIIGNSALAVQQGVFFYLEYLGYRWLAPGKIWEIIPSISSPYKAGSILTQPNYELRSISKAHGFGGRKEMELEYDRWAFVNRLGGSFPVRVGHAYDEIVSGNIETFKQHPEYFSTPVAKGAIPENPKFNIANKDLVKLVVDDASKRMDNFKKWGWNTKMISMEPSDGGGFCETGACKAFGKASNQVFYLTNEVARSMQRKYPGTWVGGFAYNEHILPPTGKLEPNIFVMVTNGFNRTNYSTENLLKMWAAKGIKVGIYDYLSVYEWDNDLPGQIPVAKISVMQSNLQKFYANGARTFLGESVMGWISRGPGEYVFARLLWDVNANTDKILDDFYNSAYGNVSGLMKKLYKNWENYPHRPALDNDLADWMSWINEAYDKASNETIRLRIDQVKMYLHYLVLYRDLKKNPSEDNMQRMMSFAFRNYETAPFATLPTLVSLPTYMGHKLLGWYAAPDQKWKKDKRPYTSGEVQQAFKQSMQQVKRGPDVAVLSRATAFKKFTDVMPLPKKRLPEVPLTFWGKTEYIIGINKKGAANFLEISSGQAANPESDRLVEIKVFPLKNGVADYAKPLLEFGQIKKTTYEKFSLQSLEPGHYAVTVNDHQKMFVLRYSPAVDYSIIMKPDEKLLTASAAGLNLFYFVVPKGTPRIRIIKTVTMVLEKPDGTLLRYDKAPEETFYIDIKPGDEGLWIIHSQAGSIYIDGVPPYLGSHPSRMLIPSYFSK